MISHQISHYHYATEYEYFMPFHTFSRIVLLLLRIHADMVCASSRRRVIKCVVYGSYVTHYTIITIMLVGRRMYFHILDF